MQAQMISKLGALGDFDFNQCLSLTDTVLVVRGQGSFTGSGASEILDEKLKNFKRVDFCDFSVNPKIEDAKRGASLAKQENVRQIISIGGGSVLDMAKLIKAFISSGNDTVALVKGLTTLDSDDPGIPIIAVPTTAGSGAEATHFAVVYIGDDKYSLAHQTLKPEIVILDGSLISSCSRYQHICSALDSTAQAIESAWARNSNESTLELSLKGLRGSFQFLSALGAGTCCADDYQNAVQSSYYSGSAINLTKTTAAHAWSYGITRKLGIPHGHAVWMTLPEVFQIHREELSDDPIFSKRMEQVLTILGFAETDNCAERLRLILSELGVADRLQEAGADHIELRRELASYVNMQRMANNPVELKSEQIKRIFAA